MLGKLQINMIILVLLHYIYKIKYFASLLDEKFWKIKHKLWERISCILNHKLAVTDNVRNALDQGNQVSKGSVLHGNN